MTLRQSMYGDGGTVLEFDMWSLMNQEFGWMSVKKPFPRLVLLGPRGFRVSGYVTRVYDYLFY